MGTDLSTLRRINQEVPTDGIDHSNPASGDKALEGSWSPDGYMSVKEIEGAIAYLEGGGRTNGGDAAEQLAVLRRALPEARNAEASGLPGVRIVSEEMTQLGLEGVEMGLSQQADFHAGNNDGLTTQAEMESLKGRIPDSERSMADAIKPKLPAGVGLGSRNK